MDMQEAGETLLATWSPGSPNGSAPLPFAHRATSISSWFSASLRHSTVTPCVPFCDVSAWLSRETPPCPWDQTTGGQPDDTSSDAWTTNSESLAEMRVAETLTTTMFGPAL